MTTTLVDTQAIVAGSGGTSTPVKLTLQADADKVGFEMKVTEVRGASPGLTGQNRRNITLYWAFSSQDLAGSLATVPTQLRRCVKCSALSLDKDMLAQVIQAVDKPVAQYLYVWFEYPASPDAYTVTVTTTEFSSGSAGGAVPGAGASGSTANPTVTSGTGYSTTVTFTRPNDATPYTIGDVVGDGTVLTFLLAGPAGGRVIIDFVTLQLALAAVAAGMGNFRLHFFNAAPTAIADNAAYNLIAADRTKYLGYIDIPVPDDHGDTLWAQNLFERLPVKLAAASTTLYGVLQTLGAFTPSALAVKVVGIHAFQEAAA